MSRPLGFWSLLHAHLFPQEARRSTRLRSDAAEQLQWTLHVFTGPSLVEGFGSPTRNHPFFVEFAKRTSD